MQPTTNAMSVAIGMPHPDSPGCPACSTTTGSSTRVQERASSPSAAAAVNFTLDGIDKSEKRTNIATGTIDTKSGCNVILSRCLLFETVQRISGPHLTFVLKPVDLETLKGLLSGIDEPVTNLADHGAGKPDLPGRLHEATHPSRTPLTGDALERGAVDVRWFLRVYRTLRRKRWLALMEAAKLSGGEFCELHDVLSSVDSILVVFRSHHLSKDLFQCRCPS